MVATTKRCLCQRFRNWLLNTRACPGLPRLLERRKRLAQSPWLFLGCSPELMAWAALTRVTRKYDVDCKSHDSGRGHSFFTSTCIILSTRWLCLKYVLILFNYNIQGRASLPWLWVGDGYREASLHGREYGRWKGNKEWVFPRASMRNKIFLQTSWKEKK